MAAQPVTSQGRLRAALLIYPSAFNGECMSAVANPQRLIVLLAALVAFGPLSIDM